MPASLIERLDGPVTEHRVAAVTGGLGGIGRGVAGTLLDGYVVPLASAGIAVYELRPGLLRTP